MWREDALIIPASDISCMSLVDKHNKAAMALHLYKNFDFELGCSLNINDSFTQ